MLSYKRQQCLDSFPSDNYQKIKIESHDLIDAHLELCFCYQHKTPPLSNRSAKLVLVGWFRASVFKYTYDKINI